MDDSLDPMDVFFEVQRGLPRQGPGLDACTLEALALCEDLPDRPEALDVGCGPGMQTLALAHALNGRVTAVDLYDEYLDELRRRVASAGLGDRVRALRADMRQLPLPDDAFDLVWSEGAAYIMGFDQALASWRRLLRPDGCIAVSELVWLTDERPEEAARFFAAAYPAMKTVEEACDSVRSAGYELLGSFVLPDAAWWEHYYGPLEAKLPGLRRRFDGEPTALTIIGETESEIAIRRNYPDAYGYAFLVGRAVA